MPKAREAPCNEKLDAELERYFAPEGASIKSILDITSRGGTSPTSLTERDVSAETFSLLSGLASSEIEAVRGHYWWRAAADRLGRAAGKARGRARGYRRSRLFKSALAEIDRRYRERKNPAR